MTFGEKLRQLRKEKNLSIEELAKLSDLTAVAISMYENNHHTPNPLSIVKLSKALECDYDTLVTTKED